MITISFILIILGLLNYKFSKYVSVALFTIPIYLLYSRETLNIDLKEDTVVTNIVPNELYKSKFKDHVLLNFTRKNVLDFVKDDVNFRNKTFNFNASGGHTDVARVVFAMVIKDFTKGKEFQHALLINEGDLSNPYITRNAKQTTIHQYHKGKGDVHNLKRELPNEFFDIIYAPQTLEHAQEPLRALKNIFELTKPGGHVILSVPYITRPHMTPVFYQVFSSHALNYIFHVTGFTNVKVYCWGNDEYVYKVLIKRTWPKIKDTKDFATPKNRYAQCMVIATRKYIPPNFKQY